MSFKHFYPDKTNNKPLLGSNPVLLYSGFVSEEPDWHYRAHSHPFSEIIYICDGCGEFNIDGKLYKASKGDILIYNAGVSHEERSDCENPLKTYFCGIDNIKINGLREEQIIPDSLSPVIKASEYSAKLETYISDLVRESSAKINGYEIVTSSLLSSIIVLVLRVAGVLNSESNTDTPVKVSKNTRDYIDKYYSQDINLSNLAKNLYISKDYLSHIFKSETGFSPMQYLIKRRIEEAKKLLVSSDLSVNKISLTVGYDDPNYFCAMFKKITGFTPLRYRNNAIRDHHII